VFAWLKKCLGFGRPRILKDLDGRFGFFVEVDGNDLVVKNAVATWFGGKDDPEDGGDTASGISTIKRPAIVACALPMNFGPCAGSPIPRLPWGTKVLVTHLEKMLSAPVIDLGPSPGTGHAIDLTVAAFREFAPLAIGKVVVDYRIIDGARYLKT
jgi:hypothetical protein